VTAWSEIPVDGRAPREPRAVDADLACLHYTSGSTGMPKGVMTTHLNLLDGTRRIDTYLKHRAGDRLLGLVSMSAPWGLLQITSMFAVGGAVVLQPTSLASEIIATIVRQQVTGVAAFPLNWIEILEFLAHTPTELPSLRYITSSGGNIPRVTLEAMPTRLPGVEVHLTYGLTEAFRSTVLPHEEFITKMGSFGKPCPNVDVFVIKDDGICGPGEQGQLIHRGTLVTKGYWNDPQTTAQSFKPCPQLRHLIGDEIVHYSGDLVRIDEDGYLWFVDRIDSLIKCSGHRVSPAEVEHIVHLSGLVTHVVAFGVADGTLGQVVHLAVSREMGEVDVAGLENWCRRNMPTYMVPRRIHVMRGEVPIAGTGKIDRRRIVDRCMLELDQTGGQGGKGQ
jgi:acyl-CoA synthetase (AMP-forming)/AMP-acid ligase II